MREFITEAGGVFSIHEKAPNKAGRANGHRALRFLFIFRHIVRQWLSRGGRDSPAALAVVSKSCSVGPHCSSPRARCWFW